MNELVNIIGSIELYIELCLEYLLMFPITIMNNNLDVAFVLLYWLIMFVYTCCVGYYGSLYSDLVSDFMVYMLLDDVTNTVCNDRIS